MSGNIDPEPLGVRVAAVRRIPEQRRRELQETQRQLRQILTPAQEAALILMGYLD